MLAHGMSSLDNALSGLPDQRAALSCATRCCKVLWMCERCLLDLVSESPKSISCHVQLGSGKIARGHVLAQAVELAYEMLFR